ncbi:hypothetical protein BDR04DRAFT_1110377 [Suillus decipiens]|nr:hypothetical protein BDR04DRAFT_1110377 [Suillus decipiens]
MAIFLMGRNAYMQAWLMKMLRSAGQLSHFQLTTHLHPLLPIMFPCYQCLILPQPFILALHLLYFLMDTRITHSLPTIMHPTIHTHSSPPHFSPYSIVSIAHFCHLIRIVPNARLHNTLYQRRRHCGVQIGIAADV